MKSIKIYYWNHSLLFFFFFFLNDCHREETLKDAKLITVMFFWSDCGRAKDMHHYCGLNQQSICDVIQNRQLHKRMEASHHLRREEIVGKTDWWSEWKKRRWRCAGLLDNITTIKSEKQILTATRKWRVSMREISDQGSIFHLRMRVTIYFLLTHDLLLTRPYISFIFRSGLKKYRVFFIVETEFVRDM